MTHLLIRGTSLLFLGVFFSAAFALECYICGDVSPMFTGSVPKVDPSCLDPYRPKPSHKKKCDDPLAKVFPLTDKGDTYACTKIKSDKIGTVRTCSPQKKEAKKNGDVCGTDKFGGADVQMCACSKDLCNAGARIKDGHLGLLCPMLFMLGMTYRL